MTQLSKPLKWKFWRRIRKTSFCCHFAKTSKCNVMINIWVHFTARWCLHLWPSTLNLPFKMIQISYWQTLQRYFSRLTPSTSLILCWQALNIGGIRVSKLCCPACSKLFHCLLQAYEEQHEDDNYWPKILTQALAAHTVPYPVQLPQWLPGDVVKHMVTFFMPLLADALQLLVSPPGDAPVISPGKVHRSQQSLSNLSVGSSNTEVAPTSEIPDTYKAHK